MKTQSINKSIPVLAYLFCGAALILCTYFSLDAEASDDWLCKEASSQRQGNVIKACGIGSGIEESAARAEALLSAKNEFNQLCSLSDDCKGFTVTASPQRTSCDRQGGLYQCHRLIVFTIGSPRLQAFVKGVKRALQALPKIKKGMTKSELVALFGPPDRVDFEGNGQRFTYFNEDMCQISMPGSYSCYVSLNQNEVLEFRNFKYAYME